jgi:hypothetical protein
MLVMKSRRLTGFLADREAPAKASTILEGLLRRAAQQNRPLMSQLGQKATSRDVRAMSAIPLKADIRPFSAAALTADFPFIVG